MIPCPSCLWLNLEDSGVVLAFQEAVVCDQTGLGLHGVYSGWAAAEDVVQEGWVTSNPMPCWLEVELTH